MITVAQWVGTALARDAGVRTVFGVVGSGNFHVTNALTSNGARFIQARHENGAAVMADAHARVTGEVGVLSVHQGPGLTNALTGLTEAAKSRTPLLVLAAEATAPTSNFFIDQAALAAAIGVIPDRVTAASSVRNDLRRAYRTALIERRTVLLSLPLDVQRQRLEDVPMPPVRIWPRLSPAPETVTELADALARARRPVFLAGRGARKAKQELIQLASRVGALLATSAVSRGLFNGDPFNLDVSGGFATPVAAELISDADLVIAWGCALTAWTTRHGALIDKDATVIAVDANPGALGVHHPIDLGVPSDTGTAARALIAELDRRDQRAQGYRTPEVAKRLAAEGRWRDVPFEPEAEAGRIDPRTLTIALDDLLPAERMVATDSGNFMGYPAMFLGVPDEHSLVFSQAFQSVGLGLATALGAAIARPDRLTVAALGDGGALMGTSELETAIRLGLGSLLIVVYDDEAYGAEVHHFGPLGDALSNVRFPPTDIAAIARGYGYAAATVAALEDLAPVRSWLAGDRSRPMLLHAKVTRGKPSWWLEEAFRLETDSGTVACALAVGSGVYSCWSSVALCCSGVPFRTNYSNGYINNQVAGVISGPQAFAGGLSTISCASSGGCAALAAQVPPQANSGKPVAYADYTQKQPIATSTALGLAAAKITYGHEIAEKISVSVRPEADDPKGKVVVKAGKTTVCVIALGSAKGSCKLTAKQLKPGTYAITATYAGAPGFRSSVSVARKLIVVN